MEIAKVDSEVAHLLPAHLPRVRVRARARERVYRTLGGDQRMINLEGRVALPELATQPQPLSGEVETNTPVKARLWP
jgi:hypothetical protein